jgi:hypothetical protein
MRCKERSKRGERKVTQGEGRRRRKSIIECK